MTDLTRWLRDLLLSGPRVSAEVIALATEAGITPKMLRRAREALAVVATRSGFGPAMRSTWQLPPDNKLDEPTEQAPPCAALGELDQNERRRFDARVAVFVGRGLDVDQARSLAIALVNRDRRLNAEWGSCIECQCFARAECSIAQPATKIHACWLRRHDTP